MSNIKQLVENMINQYFLEDASDTEKTLFDIKSELSSKYEITVTKSTLGGGEPSYFMKVFGPKSTWKNGIALNSPVHMMFSIRDGKIEQSTISYQIKNAKAKMRATKFSSQSDLKKKIIDYFKKNDSKFQEILGE